MLKQFWARNCKSACLFEEIGWAQQGALFIGASRNGSNSGSPVVFRISEKGVSMSALKPQSGSNTTNTVTKLEGVALLKDKRSEFPRILCAYEDGSLSSYSLEEVEDGGAKPKPEVVKSKESGDM